METKIVRNDPKPGSKPIKAKTRKRKVKQLISSSLVEDKAPIRSLSRPIYPIYSEDSRESGDFKRALETVFSSRGLLPTDLPVQVGSTDPVFAVIIRLLKESDVPASKDLLNYYYLFNDAYTQDAYDYYYSQAKRGDAFARARLGQLSKQGRLQACSTELQIIANAFSYECDAASEKLKSHDPSTPTVQVETPLVEVSVGQDSITQIVDTPIVSIEEKNNAFTIHHEGGTIKILDDGTVEAHAMSSESVKDVIKKLRKRSKTTKKKSSRSNKKRS